MAFTKFISFSLTFSQVVWLFRLLVYTSHTGNIHKLWDKTIGIISLSPGKIEDILRTSLGEIKSSSPIDSNFVCQWQIMKQVCKLWIWNKQLNWSLKEHICVQEHRKRACFSSLKVVSAERGHLSWLWPPMRFEPRTHMLRGWIIDFPSQVPRRLLDYPELNCLKATLITGAIIMFPAFCLNLPRCAVCACPNPDADT